MEYLEKHNIYQLIDVIGASVFYNRPDNPVQFIIDELQALQRIKQSASEPGHATTMFTDADLDTLFSMFSKKMDTITGEQAITGLRVHLPNSISLAAYIINSSSSNWNL